MSDDGRRSPLTPGRSPAAGRGEKILYKGASSYQSLVPPTRGRWGPAIYGGTRDWRGLRLSYDRYSRRPDETPSPDPTWRFVNTGYAWGRHLLQTKIGLARRAA